MALGIKIVPKPYRFNLYCDCGRIESYDPKEAKKHLDKAITDAFLSVVGEQEAA